MRNFDKKCHQVFVIFQVWWQLTFANCSGGWLNWHDNKRMVTDSLFLAILPAISDKTQFIFKSKIASYQNKPHGTRQLLRPWQTCNQWQWWRNCMLSPRKRPRPCAMRCLVKVQLIFLFAQIYLAIWQIFLQFTNISSKLTNIFCDLQIYVFKQMKIACFRPERGPVQVWWVKVQLAQFSNKWFHFFINQLLAMSGQPN